MTGVVEWMAADDLNELVRLHCAYINYGYGVAPRLKEALENPENICLKYTAPSGVMAGLLIYVEGTVIFGSHGDILEKIREIVGEDRSYSGEAILVTEEYRHWGISGLLYWRAKEELVRRGAKYVIHELWMTPDGRVPAMQVLDMFGERIDMGCYRNFYKGFDLFGYFCPICGRNCICSAHVFLSRVE
ncbi:MAG: hypothetical protein LBQ36_06015 [Synergistaceae bacterium]|nr:hypothetical protein [Synergistaceae bacterium]